MPISVQNWLGSGVPAPERAAIFGGRADTGGSLPLSEYAAWPQNQINIGKVGSRNVTSDITRALERGDGTQVAIAHRFDGSDITLFPVDFELPAITDPDDDEQAYLWSSVENNAAAERIALAFYYEDDTNPDISWYGWRSRGAVNTTNRFAGFMRSSTGLATTDTDSRATWPLDGTIVAASIRYTYISGTSQNFTVVLRIAGADVGLSFTVSPSATPQYSTLSGLSIPITNGDALNCRVQGTNASNGTMDVQFLVGFVPD